VFQDNLERCQDSLDKLVLFHHQSVEFKFKMITSHLLAQHLGRRLLELQMITSHLLAQHLGRHLLEQQMITSHLLVA
jgi:hypothetical protein